MGSWTGPQASARDLYPNIDGYTVAEYTNPETTEMDHYTSGAATSLVENPDGVRIPTKRFDALKFLGLIFVAVLLLWLIGKA